MAQRIAIVGAGISGLSLAWQIRRRLPDAAIRIFEKNSRPGGNIWSERQDGFLVEMGPNGFPDSKTSTRDLCRELGLTDKLISASEGARKNRYIFWNGRLQALPNSLLSFLGSRLLSSKSKWLLLTEKYRRNQATTEDETVDAFARRRVGDEIANIVADAMVTGIHGGDPKVLSVKSAFPRLAIWEKDTGSVLGGMKKNRRLKKTEALSRGEQPPGPPRMWGFRDGLRVLIEKLAEAFRDELVLNADIQKLEKLDGEWRIVVNKGEERSFDSVVLTCPAYAQAKILEKVDQKLSQELNEIPYNRIAVAALGFRGIPTQFPTDGFGFISPQSLKRDIVGVQWCSSIYPGRANEGTSLWRVLCGGWNRPEIVDWPDEKLLSAVLSELKISMGVTEAPVFQKIVRWPKAIPQYLVGHSKKISTIMELLHAHSGLFLGGNAFRGVAINDCTEDATYLAEQITMYLRTPDKMKI